MKNTALKVWLTAAVLIPVVIYAQPRPGNPTSHEGSRHNRHPFC